MRWTLRVILTVSLSLWVVRHNDHSDWSISSTIKMVNRHTRLWLQAHAHLQTCLVIKFNGTYYDKSLNENINVLLLLKIYFVIHITTYIRK